MAIDTASGELIDVNAILEIKMKLARLLQLKPDHQAARKQRINVLLFQRSVRRVRMRVPPAALCTA